jgi:hypothetical protein
MNTTMEKVTDAMLTGLKHVWGAATFGAYHYYVSCREHDLALQSIKQEREALRLDVEKYKTELHQRHWFGVF